MRSNYDDFDKWREQLAERQFNDWAERMFGRVLPVRNPNEFLVSAEDERFLKGCGIKTE